MTTSRRPTIGRSANRIIVAGRMTITGYGMATAGQRPLPEFLVIGAKRGGSTSFYFDLVQHSHVCTLFPSPAHLPKAELTKGIHFFDQNYGRGLRWYRAHLPSRFVRARQQNRVGAPIVTGEASPYYLFHPAAAARAAAVVPNARIIAVLRDPVQRTYSHWKERRRSGAETLDFTAALAAEHDRVGTVEESLRADRSAYSYAHENFSYVAQSEYARALRRWYDHFPPERILILASEDYYADPATALQQAHGFLGLPAEPVAGGDVRNAARGDAIDAGSEQRLREHFAPLNRELESLTGRQFPWPY